VILRPFVPFSTNDQRTELQAYMTASSAPETYGQLTTYIVEEVNGRLPDGPLRVAGQAESTEEISRRISLDNVGDGGTEVAFGDLQLIPVAGGLIYVRPYYVSVPQNSAQVGAVTEYRAVIVSYNDRSVLEATVTEGLAALFPGFESDVGDAIDEPTEPGGDDGDTGTETDDDSAAPDTDTDAASDDPIVLLEEADQAFLEADEALAAGDLGLYQEKIDEARDLIDQAFAILEQP
jgi:uncharacterized membrane protein (UPF0182 family)